MSKKKIQVLIMMLTPYISAVAGAVATWVIVHLHFLSLFHVGHDQTAAFITNLVVFSITTGLVYLTAHTKLFPELVRWAENLLGQPLQPTSGTLMMGEALVAPPTNNTTVIIHTTGDVSVPPTQTEEAKATS